MKVMRKSLRGTRGGHNTSAHAATEMESAASLNRTNLHRDKSPLGNNRAGTLQWTSVDTLLLLLLSSRAKRVPSRWVSRDSDHARWMSVGEDLGTVTGLKAYRPTVLDSGVDADSNTIWKSEWHRILEI